MTKLIDSAIEYKVLNSRAVSSNGSNAMNKAFYVDRDGTLWAAFFVTYKNINVYRSNDNGFSWEWVTTAVQAGRSGTVQGSPLFFMKSQTLDKIYLVVADGVIYEIPSTEAGLVRDPDFNLLVPSIIRQFIPQNQEYITGQDGYRGNLCSICGDPDSTFYMFYANMPGSYLKCAEYSMTNSVRGFQLAETAWELWANSAVFSTATSSEKIDSVAKDRYCYLAFTNLSDNVEFIKYDKQSHAFGTPVTISVPDLHSKDPSIAIDGNDSLLMAWGETTTNDTDIDIKIATSLNGGTTWTTQSVTKPFNTTAFLDPVTLTPEVRISLLADVAGGFLLSAIFISPVGYSTLYVKKITTEGVQDAWKELNSKSADITGNQFFRPLNDRLPYFGNMSSIRSAYQVGEGNQEHGNDTILTSVFQESLAGKAYVLNSTSSSLGIDPLTSGQLRLDFKVVGSLSDSIDYYNGNVVGTYTDSYIDAMNKIGVSVKVHKYEPVEASTDTGGGSYTDPTEYTTKIVIDPQTYDFPAIAKETAVFTQYIARDIRKAFFKPDFFMGRTFIINDGGYIKRTVWTLSYIGNDYEISQVVPRFMNNEICFYEANLYVIGPSNDPFRKITLPSET